MEDASTLASGSEPLPARRMLQNLGYFGHFLHVHAGGRSGKQHILVKLLKNGPISQRELLEETCISSAAISEVTAKLEAEGLITRTRPEADRRQLVLALTPEGEARAEELLAKRRAFEEQAFSCLSDQEQLELLSLLDRISDHWHAIESAEREA